MPHVKRSIEDNLLNRSKRKIESFIPAKLDKERVDFFSPVAISNQFLSVNLRVILKVKTYINN